MNGLHIKRNHRKTLNLAMAAGLLVTFGLMPVAAFAQGMMGGMNMMHGADVKLVQQQGDYRPLRIPAILDGETVRLDTFTEVRFDAVAFRALAPLPEDATD